MDGLALSAIIKNNDFASILLADLDFGASPILILTVVAFDETLLSNLKSNTAEASNVIQSIKPIMVNVSIQPAVIINLACSTAMFLEISTPLKAIFFS